MCYNHVPVFFTIGSNTAQTSAECVTGSSWIHDVSFHLEYTPIKYQYAPIQYQYAPIKYVYTLIKYQYTPIKYQYAPIKYE